MWGYYITIVLDIQSEQIKLSKGKGEARTVNKDTWVAASPLNHACTCCVSSTWADMEYIYGCLNTLDPYILSMLHLSACSTHHYWQSASRLWWWDRERARKRQQQATYQRQQCLLGNVCPVGGCQLKVIYFLVALHALSRCRHRGDDERGNQSHGEEAITARVGITHTLSHTHEM